jgi:NAD(P)-dependent dehydrogenase (short-subunit alcohol dehydrogenase family)
MDIAGHVAFVTGGASGLGWATVQTLRATGATVVAFDRDEPRPDVAKAADDGIAFCRGDVRDEEAVGAALDAAAALGGLRAVVNCAGTGDAIRTVARTGPYPLDKFQRVIDINLIGTFNVIRLAAERMSRLEPLGEERGVIVNTASVAAFEGQIGQAAYAASKAGVAGMTLPVARDLAGLGIRVVTIAPGLFDTPLLAQMDDDAKAALGRQVPHPARLGQPEEYAALAAHVVANPMLNGETIRLDGAIRMAPGERAREATRRVTANGISPGWSGTGSTNR